MGNIFSIQCGDALISRCWGCIAQQPLYICEFEDNLEALQTAWLELRELSNDVMRTVINQQTPDMVQLDQVRGWLAKVEITKHQVVDLIDRGRKGRQKLCISGFCSKNCKSSYLLGKCLAQSLKHVVALKAVGASFTEVVMTEPAKQLQSDLETLKTTRERLLALKEDLEHWITLEEGPEQRPLKQVQLWLSIAETTINEADELIREGPQEVSKFFLGDISNYLFVGRVANKLGAMTTLISQGDFGHVVGRAPSEPDYVRELQDNLRELKSKREELWALREDVVKRVELGERERKKPLQQVSFWLSNVEKMITEADELLIDAPKEMERLHLRDFSNNMFMRNVGRLLNDAVVLIANGDFRQVVEVALPERVLERIHGPIVGSGVMLGAVWSCLLKDEVGILGIYGIGGVGKTSLLIEINNKFASTLNDFDVVILVVVSKDLKLEKIQEDIWKKIGFCDDKWLKQSSNEKAEDISYMMRRKKFVLLLDDVWQQFNLTDVGVPPPNVLQNGSKVVVTARSSAICMAMDAEMLMKVKPLTSEDAWKLFHKKVGDVDADIIPLAQQVASECCGLPIALITIGRAMASRKSIQEWRHALKVLKRSTSNLQGVEDEIYQDMEMHVFKRLKFSYDCLPNNIVQSCFLYCSLFPEDFKIVKNDLVHYWICENFCSIEEGYFIVGTLVRQGLLEEEGKYVKMHDVIRDMALWIARGCEEKEEKFFVKAGSQLTKVPRTGEWEGAIRVSLMANSFKNFQAIGTNCSNAVTLLLSHNPNLDSIREAPFFYMFKLTVLDLSETVIEELPLEISGIVSLQYLNLSHTRLHELPKELSRLVRLKYLNLDHTGLIQMIPAQLLYFLSELQVLKMFLCGSMTYQNIEDNVLANGNLLIQELLHLKNLVELSITIRSASELQKLSEEPRLLNCTRALVLQEIKFMKSLDISSLAMAKHLNLLLMFGNINVEELGVEVTEARDASGLSNNQLIYSSLQEVVVSNYNGMRELTWVILAPNLTILRVTFNEYMESIISPATLGGLQDGDGSSNLFPKLQVLELYGLPKLKSIYWKALAFPCLREIDVYDCPQLKKLPLNSSSAMGCKVVVKGEESWWRKLEWEDDATQAAFSSSFQKI